MRVFLTGATGFIGSAVRKRLSSRGHDLLALSRLEKQVAGPDADRTRWIAGDLKEVDSYREEITAFGAEALVHLAWEGLPDYSFSACLANLNHSASLFATATECGCRFIVSAGSCWEYAEPCGETREDALLRCDSPFPVLKNAVRLAGEEVAARYGGSFCWLRLFYVYGPGQRKDSLIPTILRSTADGRRPDIRTPQNRNDFVHVDDVAGAVATVLEKQPRRPVYNVGFGKSVAVGRVARELQKAMGKTVEKGGFEADHASSSVDFWADRSAIGRDVGWYPLIDIKTGIGKTVDAFAGAEK